MSRPDAAALELAHEYESEVVPNVTAPCASILLSIAQPRLGERAVDVATGTGIVARLLAPIVGVYGRVVAVDANPAMLEVARTMEQPPGASIEWMEGNAQDLPLPDAGFDLAICQHGLQFMPDGTQALREIHRVLHAGGLLVLAVWDSLEHNPFPRSIWTAIARRLGVPPEPFAVQFGCGDPAEVHQMLEDAGFREINMTPCSLVVRRPRGPDYVAEFISGVRRQMPPLDALSDEGRAALAREVERECGEMLAQHTEDGQLVYTLSMHIANCRA